MEMLDWIMSKVIFSSTYIYFQSKTTTESITASLDGWAFKTVWCFYQDFVLFCFFYFFVIFTIYWFPWHGQVSENLLQNLCFLFFILLTNIYQQVVAVRQM